MGRTSRRSFISIAGIGTAAGLAAAVAPGAATAAPAEDTSLPAHSNGSMAAFVHDVHKGEVALMIEGHEVLVTDRVLTARLVRAYDRATSHAAS